MEAIEFKSKIKDNHIIVPEAIQSKLKRNEYIRVILLIEDTDDAHDGSEFQQTTQKQFLKGYASSDSIYDK